MVYDPLQGKPVLRLLIVEDDPSREQALRAWLPADVRVVVAASAGRALGILHLDRGRVFAGIILDHDLQERPGSEADQFLSGRDVARAVIQFVSKDVPILVHSVNALGSVAMVNRLREAGFGVTKIPMTVLTEASLRAWLQTVRELWEEDASSS
jgi:CheY-like chemotaxis protein